jgi:cation diffusion facilitator CzcD-associated flavoprotein CzcO
MSRQTGLQRVPSSSPIRYGAGMSTSARVLDVPRSRTAEPDWEVVTLGAGVGGIYQIKRLVDLGVKATVLDLSPDLGGTWYWNRYPGARFDSESYTYGYSFSKELLDEWHWTERFSGQPENLRYLNHVADKFDLRRHMQFDSKVDRMRWDEQGRVWHLHVEGREEEITARFVITAIGLLTVSTPPRIPGMEDFRGGSWHTFHWPHEPVELAGKKVGVIGTGATCIQVIAEIADKVGELKVFQRRPNWSAPLANGPISDEEMADIRRRYDEIFATCAETPGGFEHEPDRRGFYAVSREERLALWDKLYGSPGFAIWMRNFREIFTDEVANAEFSEYVAERTRERVKDPKIAEKLIPKDHGFGWQRVPMESGYFEVYNRDNVELVDLSETPIERITETGIQTTGRHFDLDIIVYATGFDAITGGYDRIEIRGTGDAKLADKWQDGPSTFLGLAVHGYPNLLMLGGPQSNSASVNFPRSIEICGNWITSFLEYVRERGLTRFEATPEAEQQWTDHVREMYGTMLMRKGKGWFTGYNSNVPGHEYGRTRYFVYNGGNPKYRKEIGKVEAAGYRGFELA